MARERHVLASRVFPVVAAECRHRQVAFSEVDLRWGVNEAEASNGQTLEICLREVDRARSFPPFFIAMLGERYGWVPTHEVLSTYLARSDQKYRERIEDGLARGMSATEFELRLALEDVPKDRAWAAKVFRRDPALSAEFARTDPSNGDSTTEDSGEDTLATLKDWLDKDYPHVCEDYCDLDGFAAAAEKFLLDGLDLLFPSTDTLTTIQRAHLAHRAYGASRLTDYVADPTLDAALAAAIATEAAAVNPRAGRVWISAPSGYGKSALLAHYSTSQPNAFVLTHYIGADGDRSLRAWRERVLDELVATGQVTSELPDVDEERWDILPLAMSEVARGLDRDVVVVLDAINVLDDSSASLARLDDLFAPEGCCLVVSATPNLVAPPRSTWRTLTVPSLDEGRRRELIVAHLARHGRSLDEDLLENLVHNPASAVPLFLRLVLDELRLHANYDSLRERVASLLASGDAGRLFLSVLAEMDEDFTHIHPGLASRASGLIVASRRGLTYPQLRTLLAEERDPVDPATGQPRLTDLVMSPLWARLGVFGLIDNGRLSLMHAALAAPLLLEVNMPTWRETLITFSDADTGEDIAERAHQMVELAEHLRLVELLSEPSRVTILWEEDSSLLAHALTLLGAGQARVSPEVAAISAAWKEREVEEGEFIYDTTVDAIGLWLTRSGFPFLAETWLTSLLESRSSTLFRDHPRTAVCLDNLALLYHAQGRFTEAESLVVEASRIFRAALGSSHPDVATSLHILAVLYRTLGRLDEAEPLFLEALAIRRNVFHPEHPRIAVILNNLGGLYLSQRRVAEAEPLILKALEMWRATLPAGHPDIAEALDNVGELYRHHDQLEKSEQVFLEALAIRRNVFHPEHPKIATCLNNLAVIYLDQNRLEEAERFFLEAIDIFRTALGPTNPYVGAELRALGGIYRTQGRLDEAERLFLEAIKTHRIVLGPKHTDVATDLNNLAEIYWTLRRLDEAERFFLEAMDIFRTALGPKDANVATCLNNLAVIYGDQNRLEEAERFFLEAIDIFRTALGPTNPYVGAELSALGGIYRTQGRLDEAERLFLEAIDIFRTARDSNYSKIANNLVNLAVLYKDQNRLNEAESLFLEALEIHRNWLPPGDPGIVADLSNLAEIYQLQERLREALDLYLQLLEIIRAVPPRDDLDIQ